MNHFMLGFVDELTKVADGDWAKTIGQVAAGGKVAKKPKAKAAKPAPPAPKPTPPPPAPKPKAPPKPREFMQGGTAGGLRQRAASGALNLPY